MNLLTICVTLCSDMSSEGVRHIAGVVVLPVCALDIIIIIIIIINIIIIIILIITWTAEENLRNISSSAY